MSPSISKVKKYIEENFKDDITLDDIAKNVGYSKYHLNRMFLENTGLTIHKYIRERRLTEAADLLLYTDQSIVDIALSIGYTSQQAFTLAFKQMFDCTPYKYRINTMTFVSTKCLEVSPSKRDYGFKMIISYGRVAA